MTSFLLGALLGIIAGTVLLAGWRVMAPRRRRPDGSGARRARASLSWLSGPSGLERVGHLACKEDQARIFPVTVAV
jgi:hypothetical protein